MKKNKPKKESFVVRMQRRGREFMELGSILVERPRDFPRALLNVVRKSLRTVWDARGGGLYACGYVVTFVWLEIRMFVEDILSAESVSGFFGEQLFEMLFRYLGESLKNMIRAFMWPVYVIDLSPRWGVVVLVAMFMLFPRWIKPALERWLFDDDDAAETPAS